MFDKLGVSPCFHNIKPSDLQDFHGVPRAVKLQLAVEAIPAPRHEVLPANPVHQNRQSRMD